jgi:hypothetical protein
MGNNRSGISHPSLNTAGGSALWTSIDNIYQLLSDQDLGRWVSFSALANSATTTVTHGFGVSFDDLKVVVYTGTYPNLTQVQTFTAAATTGFEKTKIDVTAPASGGPFSGYVLVIHDVATKQRVMTTTQRLALASPYVSMLVYDSDLKSLMVWNGSLWTPAGGGATLKSTITQAAHGFTAADIGAPLYINGSIYTKARADSSTMAEVAGLLESIVDANTFSLALCGDVTIASAVRGGANLTSGEIYFLNATNAGQITITEPSVVGSVSKPIGVAKDQTTLSFFNMRGSVVGSSNVRTQISIANNATSTIQNVSAYEAGELTGWIAIAATTPLKFYVSAQFAKNGAGTDYNLSYQTTGDTPPSGFSVAVTAAGIIQIVMPSVTGFASASINYALNAPAVGTTFPLSVSTSSLVNKNKIQKKTQSTTILAVSGGTTAIPNLTFNNLVVGKNYRVSLHADLIEYVNAIGAAVKGYNNAVEIIKVYHETAVSASNRWMTAGTTQLFTAAASTLSFNFVNTAGPNGSAANTAWVILEELNDTDITTDFT